MIPERPAEARPVWIPPVVSVVVLFVLFVAGTMVRRAELGDAARTVMIGLSTIAAVAITIYGIKMVIEGRVRGWASAVAGLVMIFLGVYTTIHVLR